MMELLVFALLPLSVTAPLIVAGFTFFKRKQAPPLFYTPFDEITGQSGVEFHEEQDIPAEDEESGEEPERTHL
ncbi:DUF3951 domain-containing protein [Rossellomorea marisflavi]|uniref:DUF3951 domain-containing protein n=1 Tax=Rossellomorea marisflavi TaxID=189381 RepID=UPI0009A85949|nr:DUF3951 domain-containing protein [Rossellomorea marisflavi]